MYTVGNSSGQEKSPARHTEQTHEQAQEIREKIMILIIIIIIIIVEIFIQVYKIIDLYRSSMNSNHYSSVLLLYQYISMKQRFFLWDDDPHCPYSLSLRTSLSSSS